MDKILNLQEGKTYVTRNGDIVEVHRSNVEHTFYKFKGTNGVDYGADGRCYESFYFKTKGCTLVNEMHGVNKLTTEEKME